MEDGTITAEGRLLSSDDSFNFLSQKPPLASMWDLRAGLLSWITTIQKKKKPLV